MMIPRKTALRVLVLALAAFASPSHANDSARFSVGAEVKPLATLNVLEGRREVQISADDIARGRIDLPAAMRVEIRSNDPIGYVLTLQPRTRMFTRAQIVGLDAPVDVGPDGASVVQRDMRERVTR